MPDVAWGEGRGGGEAWVGPVAGWVTLHPTVGLPRDVHTSFFSLSVPIFLCPLSCLYCLPLLSSFRFCNFTSLLGHRVPFSAVFSFTAVSSL
jgi:hypothetical protein